MDNLDYTWYYKSGSAWNVLQEMGNLKELASMIPGVGKAIKDIDIDDNAFKSIEAIIMHNHSFAPKSPNTG